ncbi:MULTISPECIES: HDOD domain-containing protein [Deefgea]|uniref:HDOD domain-containing protein n=1 Tax=Deefgea chitinilytica TaxID=570276 RepID=A0ABS2C730_9NEIS|nr:MULTISPECIES: HDOD domain-containing protein [Deefgea]MBM5569968.1 HDOD domain-containing protein [Deefgea chitinilytica]MBM9887197.1 HDOD domain-containing protein [Deefgea sp. CFH1-16]
MKLEEVFEQTHKLPTIPKVVQELIDSFSNDDIDIDTIGKKIAQDQVITAKVLRLANSAHFGASRQIGSVQEAVVVLGFNTVRTLVVASGITGAFVATPGFDRKAFWKHSLAVATISKWLAKQAKTNGEVAFTCGMVHNIGEMLIHIVAPEIAVKIDKFVESGGDRVALEDNNIGFDYVMVGEELARRWNFPTEIQQAIKFQNTPTTQEPSDKLTAVLALAKCISNLQADQPSPEELAAQIPEDILSLSGISKEGLNSKLAELADLSSGMEEIIG